MAAATITSMSLTGVVSSGFRHVPSTSEAAAEMWLVDDAGTPVGVAVRALTSDAALLPMPVPAGEQRPTSVRMGRRGFLRWLWLVPALLQSLTRRKGEEHEFAATGVSLCGGIGHSGFGDGPGANALTRNRPTSRARRRVDSGFFRPLGAPDARI